MSVVDKRGVEIEIPRSNKEEYWLQLARDYCGDDPLRRRNVAQLILHVVCNWTLEEIGVAHGQCKGRVSRQVREAEEGLRQLAQQQAG